jgi:hypothetical protein
LKPANGGPATGLYGYLSPEYAGWHKRTGRWRHLWADRLVMQAATQQHADAVAAAQQASQALAQPLGMERGGLARSWGGGLHVRAVGL